MSNLVIVESPAKAKTIAKYLNASKALKHLGQFQVVSSMGHIRDLKKGELGIQIDKGFLPEYEINQDKCKTVKELQTLAKASKMVWLASDHDREGESIAMHLKEVLRLKQYQRVTFTEITPKALEYALQHPRKIDDHLVDAQEARRILDRLVGFKLSPLLWKRFKTANGTGLSAGRVQSAVLHLVLEKEKEVEAFSTNNYWHYLGKFDLNFKGDKQLLEDVHLYRKGTIAKDDAYDTAVKLLKKIKGDFRIVHYKQKESKKSPDQPFITSTLQQEAYNKHGFALKRTMSLAQELYEKGYITYMRTDSYNLSDDFREAAEKHIIEKYGAAYYSGGAAPKKVVKNAQEAHEAIRPTHVETMAEEIPLSPEHKKLYEMIWKRTVAYLMKPCIYDELDISIQDKSFDADSFFVSTFSKVKFNGYMILYGVSNEKYDFQKYMDAIANKQYALDCKQILAKNTWASPPSRFNESSIIRLLEKEGIGRPSTYAGIMNKLFEKSYIIKSDISGKERQAVNIVYEKGTLKEQKQTVVVGAEKNKLVPTDIGKQVDAFLGQTFAYIVDKTFTANMEADLDRVAEGEKQRNQMLAAFWSHFSKDLAKVSAQTEKFKKTELKTESKVLKVEGVDYIIRLAKYGPVIEYREGEDKRYINLKPFLRLVRKELMEVNEDDIDLLTRTPIYLGLVDNKKVYLAYGPYGFYAKLETMNVTLPQRTILKYLESKEMSMKDVQSAIDYKQKQASQDDGAEEKKTKTKKLVFKKK